MGFLFKLSNLISHILLGGFTSIADEVAVLVCFKTAVGVGFTVVYSFLFSYGHHNYLLF